MLQPLRGPSVAKQDRHPGTWHDRLSDGCSGIIQYARSACLIHDVDYWWGGKDPQAKRTADNTLYRNTRKAGWFGKRIARVRLWGVRRFTWNEAPRKGSLGGPPPRRYATMFQALKHGQTRVEAWNWLGPGRGEHTNMEAQDHLLPEQMPVVAAAREVA